MPLNVTFVPSATQPKPFEWLRISAAPGIATVASAEVAEAPLASSTTSRHV